jgi:diacylglycerol kinase (ATP)
MSKTLIILNPHAANGHAGRVWREVEPLLWRELGELIVAVTQNADEVARHLEQAYQVGVRRVIAIGGDGTNHALVNALTAFNLAQAGDSPMIYGNIPIGSGTDWARGKGIPIDDLPALTRWIAHATPTPTDLGMLTTDGGSQYFLNIASAGMGGDVAQRVNRRAKRAWTFLQATIETLLSYQPEVFEITIDGQAWYEGYAYAVAVANGTTFGHGMRVAPNAHSDDGMFDVILIKRVPKLEILMALRRLYDGSHLTHRAVESTRAKEVALHSPRGAIDMELDGEYNRGRDVSFKVQPGLLQVLL